MKKIVLLFILISSYSFSQTVNDYQYVIVPAKYTIFKENDKYRLNTLTKLLLQKYGFKSYFVTDSLPDEIANSNCNKLYADLEKDNNFFSTKVRILLKDCKDKIVYQTEFGSSKEKDLMIAYNQALRDAGKSFDQLHYKYNGKTIAAKPIVAITSQAESITPLSNVNTTSVVTDSSQNFYFAQPTSTGFQVVNNEPKVILRLLNTSQKNVFIASKGSINGVVITKNGQWFFEYYENSKLVSEALNLKF